ncbi:AAA family ATPase [Streptomyces sp. NPDC001941]|uniref:ATP-binding protein n=1 Tax=Streptomyces sp. NPDC001941 TaxID=3154659 RepID=UPI0033265F9A
MERDAELDVAARAVTALRAGRAPRTPGGPLVYRADAGLGKTALLQAVHRAAADRCTVWTARGSEAASCVPFHVVRQLLRPALAGLPEGEARTLFGERYETTAPALGLLAPPTAVHADPRGVRDGLDRLVARLAARLHHRPPVLLVDDAHWADAESLAWLAELPPLPLLVVLAHRPATGPAGALLDRAADRAGSRVTLRALARDSVAALVRGALGDHAEDAFCRAVWRVTRGNPYETVELLARARARALAPAARSAAQVRELAATGRGSGLVARLEGLGSGPTRLARAAAVLGPDVRHDLAVALADLTPGEGEHCLRRLREARIVTDGELLEFVHPLIGSAVYRSVPAGTRTALHTRAAHAVSRAGLGAAAASRHLLQIPPDDDQGVVEQLRQAAREHLAVGAPDAARRCLERALAERPGPRTRARVLYELGCAALLTSPPTTVRHLRAALELPGLDATLRTDATCRLAQALAHNDQVPEAAEAVAREAARTPHGPDGARLRAARFMYACFRAAEDDGPARSRRLADLADHLPGRDNAERALLSVRAFDAMLRGEDADLVGDLCDRAVPGGRPARGLGWTDTEWGFETPAMVGIAYAYTDRLDRAEALFTEAVRAFEISGWSGAHLAFAHTFLALVQRRRGNLVEAEELLRESLRLADRVGTRLPVHWNAACMLIETLIARGKVAEARAAADTHAFGPPWTSATILPDGRSVLGRLLLAEGRTREAVAELERAGRALTARGRHNGVWAPWATDLARAVAATDPERGRRLAARARRDAERHGTRTAIGEALRCEARFADPPEALALLARATEQLAASPSRYEHALARFDYGHALACPATLTSAATLAANCGAATPATTAHPAPPTRSAPGVG